MVVGLLAAHSFAGSRVTFELCGVSQPQFEILSDAVQVILSEIDFVLFLHTTEGRRLRASWPPRQDPSGHSSLLCRDAH